MKTGKLTAQVLQMALKKFLEAQKHGPKLHQGQQSLKQLKQHGAALSNIEITDANIAAFKPCAKKYGVDFTLRKDKTTQPPHYIVIFKSRDADNLEQAFKVKCPLSSRQNREKRKAGAIRRWSLFLFASNSQEFHRCHTAKSFLISFTVVKMDV